MIIDHYAVLGVKSTATPAAIKTAYRRLALENHPDRAPANEHARYTLRFQYINSAYNVLSAPASRRQFDQERHGQKCYNPLLDDVSDDGEGPQDKDTADQTFFTEFQDAMGEEFKDAGESTHGGGFGLWSWVGGLSGAALGFIIMNLPGAVAGFAGGRYLGGMRDKHGASVMTVFQSMPSDKRRELITMLAMKVLNVGLGNGK